MCAIKNNTVKRIVAWLKEPESIVVTILAVIAIIIVVSALISSNHDLTADYVTKQIAEYPYQYPDGSSERIVEEALVTKMYTGRGVEDTTIESISSLKIKPEFGGKKYADVKLSWKEDLYAGGYAKVEAKLREYSEKFAQALIDDLGYDVATFYWDTPTLDASSDCSDFEIKNNYWRFEPSRYTGTYVLMEHEWKYACENGK